MTFHDTHQRLVAHLRNRVQNGELTERALARHLGISQPHVNNVLRGRRKLSPEIADLLLKFFHVSVLDLYADVELRTNLHARIARCSRVDVANVLKNPLGPGNEWSITTDGRRRYLWPSPSIGIAASTVFARMLPDHRMSITLSGCDMALLDTSTAARLDDAPSGVFVVQHSSDTLLRWIRGGFRSLYLIEEQNVNQPLAWERILMQEEQRLEFVKARVMWLGAESSLRRA